MNLTDILDKIDYIDYTKNNDDEITNVTNDSRKIEKGGVFVTTELDRNVYITIEQITEEGNYKYYDTIISGDSAENIYLFTHMYSSFAELIRKNIQDLPLV